MSYAGLLELDKEVITERFKNGESCRTIAETYGCNQGTVYLRLREWGLIVKTKHSAKEIAAKKDEILDLNSQGLSSKAIAKKLGLSGPSVLRILAANGIDSSHRSTVNKDNLLKDKSEQLKTLWAQDLSCNEIAEILGHSATSVSILAEKLGLEKKDFKIKVDETFFENIDTPNKAYVLGWMFSDGNVTDEGRVRIAIHKKDQEILEKIAKIMKFEGELRYNCNLVELGFSRIKVMQDLVKLGCTPRKSKTLEFPRLEEHLIPHFMRGMYDGDGSYMTKKGFTTNLTCCRIFIEKWAEILDHLGIEHKIYYRADKPFTAALFTTKISESIKLVHYLYKDSEISLARKFGSFHQFLP